MTISGPIPIRIFGFSFSSKFNPTMPDIDSLFSTSLTIFGSNPLTKQSSLHDSAADPYKVAARIVKTVKTANV